GRWGTRAAAPEAQAPRPLGAVLGPPLPAGGDGSPRSRTPGPGIALSGGAAGSPARSRQRLETGAAIFGRADIGPESCRARRRDAPPSGGDRGAAAAPPQALECPPQRAARPGGVRRARGLLDLPARLPQQRRDEGRHGLADARPDRERALDAGAQRREVDRVVTA